MVRADAANVHKGRGKYAFQVENIAFFEMTVGSILRLRSVARAPLGTSVEDILSLPEERIGLRIGLAMEFAFPDHQGKTSS